MNTKERAAILDFEVKAWPDLPTRALARKIYDEHPAMFSGYEACRSAVKYRRGVSGEKNRRKCVKKRKDDFRKPQNDGWKVPLPDSLAKPHRNVLLPEGKTLLLSDIHVPYHDKDALDAALKYGDHYQPDTVYLNGDAADFFSVSRWETDPEERDLARELSYVRELLYHIRERYPKAEIYYKIGNHEERWEKYLWSKAPALIGVSDFQLRRLMGFQDLGIREVKGKQKAKAGKNLTIIHGHELPGAYTPVNFARTLQMTMGVCAIGGHRHQTSEHAYKSDNDEFIHCWSVGCLCDMRPEYAVVNRWNHGFATIELHRNDFRVDNLRIVDGKVY